MVTGNLKLETCNYWLAFSVSVGLGLGLIPGCSREPSRPAAATAPTIKPLEEPPPAELLPREGGPQGYVGSRECRECHQDQYASWHRTFHRTMTQFARPENVHANFNGAILTNDGARYVLSQKTNELSVHIESVAPPEPGRPGPEPVDVPVSLVTGSHHMHVFWVANGMGNCQIGFPFTWLIPEQRWVPRNTTFLRPPETIHRPEAWNFVCARCHTTAPEPNLDRAAKTFDTRAQEMGIGG